VSFAIAGAISAAIGNNAAFIFGGSTAFVALVIAWAVMPREPAHASHSDPRGLLDFRPVFRNRPAMAWIAGYTVHTWELAACRAWGVTFLTIVAARTGSPAWLPSPPVLFTIANLVSIVVSISGNELSQKFGRLRVVTVAFGSAALLSLCTGWTVDTSMLLATCLLTAWLAAIFVDSSALTAGTVQAAEPRLRGSTMGLHSMGGYIGGFIGPLGIGFALDLAGDNLTLGWGLGFGHLAVVTLAGYAILLRLGRPPR
jgi:hypothetical protein